MDWDIAGQLLSNISLAGALVAIAFIARPVLLAQIHERTAQRELEQKRLDTEVNQTDKLAAALNNVTTRLQISDGLLNQMIERYAALPTREDLKKAGSTMRTWAETHDKALTSLHTAVQGVPAAVWAASDPKLDALKMAFLQAVEDSEARIMSQLDPQATNARAAVRAEFQAMQKDLEGIDRVAERLSSIETVLKRLEDRNVVATGRPSTTDGVSDETPQAENEG